jgi:hypothetical protein
MKYQKPNQKLITGKRRKPVVYWKLNNLLWLKKLFGNNRRSNYVRRRSGKAHSYLFGMTWMQYSRVG